LITKGADLFRYKGVMACKGMPKKYIFQGVGMIFNGNFSKLSWGKDEKRECRFVFIGRNLNRQELMDGVNACRVENNPLRFKAGDPVLAQVGTWTPGHILLQWDDGNPYRILLDDGQGTMVWGPMDVDDFVKANPKGKKMDQKKLTELLKQNQFVPMPASEQVCVLYAGVRGYLDKIQTTEISKFEKMYLEAIHTKASHIPTTIRTEGYISDKTEGDLKAFIEEFLPTSGLKLKS